MRGFTALVWREISERRALFAAAAVASVLPLLAPLLPATGGNPAADTRAAVMWVMVGLLVPLFALLLGVSFIGRDLSEGRLGFDFAQPLPGPAIWFGKLTAVVLLVWAAQALIMLPTVLLSGDPGHLLLLTGLEEGPGGLTFVSRLAAPAIWLLPLGIVLVGHAVSVVWRDRSAWLVLDVIMLVVVAAGAWWALRPFLSFPDLDSLPAWQASQWWWLRFLLSSDAPMTALAGLLWVVGAAFLGLIVAGAVQLTSGRVDLRRAHRSLSAALWGVLAVAVVALVGWSGWVRSATPADLLRVEHLDVASGDWVVASGPSLGRLDYQTRFVVNAVDGRWVRAGSVPSVYWSGWEVWFSGDGLHVFWTEEDSSGGRELMYANLEGDELNARRLGFIDDGGWQDLDVSFDGGRIAVVEDRVIAVYDVESGDQLGAVAITGEFSPDYCWFEDPGTLMIAASTAWVGEGDEATYRSTTYRFDVASKTLSGGDAVEERGGSTEPETGHTLIAQNQRYLDVVEDDGGERLILVDASSGEPVADLGWYQEWGGLRDLGDGRFLVLRGLDGLGFMDCFDADGVRLQRVEYGRCDVLTFATEPAPGRFMVGIRVRESSRFDDVRYRTSIVDSRAGLTEKTIDGFFPLVERPWRVDLRAAPYAWQPGSVSSRLLVGDDGSLQLLNDETGTLDQVIPAIESVGESH